MVRIFKILNGSSDIGIAANRHPERQKKKRARSPIPGNLTIYKGSFAASLSRGFANFIFTNSIALKYYTWLNGTEYPDEYFWQTLLLNPRIGIPNSFPGYCMRRKRMIRVHEKNPWMQISRYQLWKGDDTCKGKDHRGSCVFGVGDLKEMISSPRLVAHKFDSHFEPAGLYCLSEILEVNTMNREDVFTWVISVAKSQTPSPTSAPCSLSVRTIRDGSSASWPRYRACVLGRMWPVKIWRRV